MPTLYPPPRPFQPLSTNRPSTQSPSELNSSYKYVQNLFNNFNDTRLQPYLLLRQTVQPHKKGTDYGASHDDVKHSKDSGKVCQNCRDKGSCEKRKEKKKVSDW